MTCPKKGCKGTVTYRFNVPTCSEHGVIRTVAKIAPAVEAKPKPKHEVSPPR